MIVARQFGPTQSHNLNRFCLRVRVAEMTMFGNTMSVSEKILKIYIYVVKSYGTQIAIKRQTNKPHGINETMWLDRVQQTIE